MCTRAFQRSTSIRARTTPAGGGVFALHAIGGRRARHTRARLMANTITLRSSDGETFEVEEDVALCVRRARRARSEIFLDFMHSFVLTRRDAV